MNGKGDVFSRPVYVYKKLSRDGFVGLPFSTQDKTGSWYIEVFFKGKKNIANLSQIRLLSSLRMYEKMGSLDEIDIIKIKNGFLRLYS